MPLDSLLQPRIGALHAGVSRQAPLLRSPSQMEEIVNYLPSVDIGGLVDRVGTSCIAMLGATNYQAAGHYMFRTADGQRWALLRSAAAGAIEVRNLVNGAQASLSIGPWVQGYIGNSTRLKYLTMSDTTLILNPSVAPSFNAPGAGISNTRCYLVIKKLNTAYQTFYVNSSAGNASVVYDGTGGAKTRDWIAQQLQVAIGSKMPGIGCTRINNVLKLTGPADLIGSVIGGNDWDNTAMTVIKGRVYAETDLPATFFHGEPILVDLGYGDAKSAYWVTYDQTTNSYKETSGLDNFATSGAFHPGYMPIRLHQTGTNSFELLTVDWVARKTGDDDSNPLPPFIGQGITDMALWKGRLWFSTGDELISSQPDDLFNFFRSSTREVVASDPVKLQTEADLGYINHVIPFRDSLMVFTSNAQCAVDGSQPIRPDTASLGTATRYTVDLNCTPEVTGDALYYTGSQEGRSVLWEYQYEQQTMNNTATDLGKHVPRYCPGSVQRIVGASQSGRLFSWTPLDGGTLYTQTSYWQGQERKQNAWAKLQFASVTNIWHHWEDQGDLFVLGIIGGYVALLSVPVDSNLGDNPALDMRIDLKQPIQVTWNETRNRSEVVLPVGYYQVDNKRLLVLTPNDVGWFTEHDLTVTWDGSQWIGWFQQSIDVTKTNYIGIRFNRWFTFSPFYPQVDQSGNTPMGRLQVHKVFMDCLRAGDFTATVRRSDRPDMVAQLSPRTLGLALVPDAGDNVQYGIPFNAQGHKASLTINSDSSSPMVVTGYTLAARYTNLFAN